MRRLITFVVLIYTAMLLYWMFIGFGRAQHSISGYRYNLVPLRTITLYFYHRDHFNLRTWAVNVIGNVAVFVPFGIMLPYLRKWSYARFIWRFVLTLFTLELAQLFSQLGSFDVDDVLLNAVGGTIGFGLYRLLRGRLSK